MRKKIFDVPSGTKYLAEIEGYELPNGILDKRIPNCGATTLALKDNYKTIIASPRVELLKNKKAQTPCTFLVIAGISVESIKEYISSCEVPKILVTYDSLGKVLDCIENMTDWRVVVDEMQYIIVDGSFKSETEMGLIRRLKSLPYVTFLTATPCMDELLEQIDIFKDIDYFQLSWHNVEKVKVLRRSAPNPIKAGVHIVEEYKKGAYPSIQISGKTLYSKECVIYVNSVKNILEIIKTTGLKPEEVNIIVGNHLKNDGKIKLLLGEEFEIGSIPLKGEKHKMFTFCTSTAFAGCDFYSTCASSFVISDCYRNNTTIDIATDLVQIAGRQRLDCNPFRKYLTFIYNTDDADYKKKEEEIKSKAQITKEVIDCLNTIDKEQVKASIKQSFKKSQMIDKYLYDYVMIKDETADAEFNIIAYVNEQFEYMVREYQYKSGITIRGELENSSFELDGNQIYREYEEQMECLVTEEPFEQRMKRYCDSRENGKGNIFTLLDYEDSRYNEYYNLLGGKRIKALGYKEKKLKEDIHFRELNKCIPYELEKKIDNRTRIVTGEIKAMISEIYSKLGIQKACKATDLELYGYKIIKECKIPMGDGTRKGGYIIKKVE